MQIIIEILFIVLLGVLFIQDIKYRAVTLWILLLGILIGGMLHYMKQEQTYFLVSIVINTCIVSSVFGVLFVYAKFKMKQSVFNVFGKGDLLFFILMAASLPSLAFIIIFVFSLLFSLIVFSIVKFKLSEKTVPLAGLQSFFLGMSIIANRIITNLDFLAL